MILKLEGLAICAGAVTVYALQSYSWWLFGILFLAPDLSMLGYLINKKIGAEMYNSFHNYFVPVVMFGVSWFIGELTGIAIALIWIAHIGFDRVLGYGLKYPTAFKDTHMQKV